MRPHDLDSRALAASSGSYLVSRSSTSDHYRVWLVDPTGKDWLVPRPVGSHASLAASHRLIAIGDYLLEWGPLAFESYAPCYPYRLFQFDATTPDPLNGPTVQKGLWAKNKFYGSLPDFGNPDGSSNQFGSGKELLLIPLNHFVLNFIPTAGRGTFDLWNFDPDPRNPLKSDPLPVAYSDQGDYAQSSFADIQLGHELIPMNNYVLDWAPLSGRYRVWSFDPQAPIPLSKPVIQAGHWPTIDAEHRLVPLGEMILDWVPRTLEFRLWRFDPTCADPLRGPLRTGVLPEGFDGATTITAVQPRAQPPVEAREQPGTIEFMRSKIKHVVYLMLENRSFDHMVGWLYEHGAEGINFIGSQEPYNGASTSFSNTFDSETVHLSKYKDGRLSDHWDLDFFTYDPYHNNSDVLFQLFNGSNEGYALRATPNMGGFLRNNGTGEVMVTYTPHQVPVLNGLGREFAISDAWFSPHAGPTDPNRAVALTGSALGYLNNFMDGDLYTYWPDTMHRPSIFKALWSNGVTDWKIYYSVEWMNFVFTYQLFLEGEIPSVDAASASYITPISQFYLDAQAGTLPAFSFLEPVWIADTGTTSYHPGEDFIPGEELLNNVYNALSTGPAWDETLLVITFDEHGGIYDHAPPPYAARPWPNDVTDGYHFDLLGPRVPTILVSPWIKQNTVFRSETAATYDHTSILSTLLHWAGVPQARWGMGDRVDQAPTFEGVLQEPVARTDRPTFTPPYDKNYPKEKTGAPPRPGRLHDLHRLLVPRMLASLSKGKASPAEVRRLSADVLKRATDTASLHRLIREAAKQLT